MDNISILIKILSIKGIGPVTAKKLIPPSYISCDSDLINFLQEKAVTLFRLKLTTDLIKSGIERGNRIIAESRNYNISFIDFNSPIYPPLLKTIENPPLVLSYKGDISLINESCVAVIGTREPTITGKVAAYNCGKSVAESSFITVSGLAKGIDSAAHLGCLDSEGKTIAVVGNGLDTVYPFENKLLARKILEGGGLLITECFIGSQASPMALIARNRILIGLCKKMIVVEMNIKGGTSNAVGIGLQNNKIIACLTNENETRVGNLSLLKKSSILPILDREVVSFIKK